MKNLLLLLMVTFHIVVYGQKNIINKLTKRHVHVKGTKVSLIPPEGFEKSKNYQGFKNSEYNACIMVTEIPNKFSKFSKQMNKSNLKTKGLDLLSKQEFTINNKSVIFIEANQMLGNALVKKYILYLELQNNSIIINGMFYDKFKDLLEKPLKESLFSIICNTNLKVNPLDGLNYKVDISGTKLKFAKVFSNISFYNVDGKLPSESEDKTDFLIGSSFGKQELEDKKQITLTFFKKITKSENFKPENFTTIEVNGLDGYEIISKIKNRTTGKLMKVYFTLLFKDNIYYYLYGTAYNQFKKNINMFKKVALTFKLK